MQLFTKALLFASIKHENQTRKQGGGSPFINHPIEVAYILVEAGVKDERILAAALLHDTLDETNATSEELETQFGISVKELVVECSDTPGLSNTQNKRYQIEKASKVSPNAKLIKLADKISNNRYVLNRPPPNWTNKRTKGYFIWAQTVCNTLKGLNAGLDKQIDEIFDKTGINTLTQEERQELLTSFYKQIAK